MTDSTQNLPMYGHSSSQYESAGGLEGITRLANRFYDIMDTDPAAKSLRDIHADDLTESRDKLICFLSGWMGGPKLFAERYGSISLPVAHQHLPIDTAGKSSWLNCMEASLIAEDYPEAFRHQLMQKFETPAESIRLMCEVRNSQQSGK